MTPLTIIHPSAALRAKAQPISTQIHTGAPSPPPACPDKDGPSAPGLSSREATRSRLGNPSAAIAADTSSRGVHLSVISL
eukprot:5215654-Pyramimonas_sp.AAC.1